MYLTAKLQRNLEGEGGREVLAALLLAATRVRGGEEGVYSAIVHYCELCGWIGANNDGGEELQKRTRIQSFKECVSDRVVIKLDL